MTETKGRKRFEIKGVVQGVGFRPHAYALAERFGLAGFVLNDSTGVVVEVEGAPAVLEDFARTLRSELPPLASIESIDERDVATRDDVRFEIRLSHAAGGPRTPVGADIAPCAECLAEIFDPEERRFRYPFTNCTNCGPRFTIARDLPYDRRNTTMASFEMCERCRAEYEDPSDRRFHAQPIACPECGPSLTLLDRAGAELEEDPLDATASLIKAGAIVALKGIGGFHLACDARNEQAVTELRRRKRREQKPLAVMVANIDDAGRLVHVDDAEVTTLASPRRPILLARRAPGSSVADAVAPDNRYLGVMLPYTPLHHLLMAELDGPLVLTSGNLSDEPIAHENDDALERLGGIADAFLMHDRDIHIRCDDSVVRVVDAAEYPIRRSRGYAPTPLPVPAPFCRTVLGVGGELKHTFCLGVGERALLSHHIGDLESLEAMRAFEHGLEHFVRIFDAKPETIAYDLHPEYMSTKWALEQESDTLGVQHHHAHIASCLADNERSDRVIGLALDGTGYGDDGTLWGCEVLVCDLVSYERIGHLRQVPLPGGAAAVKEPWRMAAIYLAEAFGEDAFNLDLDLVGRTRDLWPPILAMARGGLNSPRASSAGRLFDAVAALCDLRDRSSYEGQAAAALEQAADPTCSRSYGVVLDRRLIDGVALVASVAQDLVAGRAVPEVAAAFHNSLAETLVAVSKSARDATALRTVALSGGTFQNLLLLEKTRLGLVEAGFETLSHRRVPPNDGGLSLGQAVIANAMRSVSG
jgi:hydrogenase maturation protein HypF